MEKKNGFKTIQGHRKKFVFFPHLDHTKKKVGVGWFRKLCTWQIWTFIQTKGHETHRASHFRCDIVAISHRIQDDTLLMFLQQKLQAQK